MGRRKEFPEVMQARFPAGTFDRIQSVSVHGEDRTTFVREAVERELRLRESCSNGERLEEVDRLVGVFTPQAPAEPRPSLPPSRDEFGDLVDRVNALVDRVRALERDI